RNVGFLDKNGYIINVKRNSRWEREHLKPLKRMVLESESTKGVRSNLEGYM
ncbi:unnamed protein product, partial [marine sediment metagenome]